MIVDYVFHITHNFSVSTLGNAGLLMDGLCILLENGCWLRVQNKGDCEEALRKDQYLTGIADDCRNKVP